MEFLGGHPLKFGQVGGAAFDLLILGVRFRVDGPGILFEDAGGKLGLGRCLLSCGGLLIDLGDLGRWRGFTRGGFGRLCR